MSINIVFKGFAQELPAAEAIDVLARVFNGDRAKAEEAFFTPNYVLRTIGSKAEIGLILPRLEKLGLRCEVVEQSQVSSGSFADHEVTVRMIACQFCGYEQPTAVTCRKCGKSFAAVKKINWKPAVNLQADEESETDTGEVYALSMMDRVRDLNVFTLRNAAILLTIVGALMGFGFVSLSGDATSKGTSHHNPIAMLIMGILKSDPKDVAKTMTYNPESGENPYANKLKSLGIDQKEFSQATGVKGGEITLDQVQATIDNNALIKKGVDDAMNEKGTSTGETGTDKAIEGIDKAPVEDVISEKETGTGETKTNVEEIK